MVYIVQLMQTDYIWLILNEDVMVILDTGLRTCQEKGFFYQQCSSFSVDALSWCWKNALLLLCYRRVGKRIFFVLMLALDGEYCGVVIFNSVYTARAKVPTLNYYYLQTEYTPWLALQLEIVSSWFLLEGGILLYCSITKLYPKKSCRLFWNFFTTYREFQFTK